MSYEHKKLVCQGMCLTVLETEDKDSHLSETFGQKFGGWHRFLEQYCRHVVTFLHSL